MKRFLMVAYMALSTCTGTPAFAQQVCPAGHPSVDQMVTDAAEEQLPFAKAPDALTIAILASSANQFPDADGLYLRMEDVGVWSMHLTKGGCHVASAGPFTLSDIMRMVQGGRKHST